MSQLQTDPLPGSVSLLMQHVRVNEDEAAFAELCQRYLPEVARLANSRTAMRPGLDAEAIANSTFRSLWHALAERGSFPADQDRDGLLRVLSIILNQKIRQHHQHESRHKRDYRRTVTDSQDVVCTQLSHELALEFRDTIQRIQTLLKPEYHILLDLKLAGYTVAEMVTHTGRPRRTLERQIEYIKKVCQENAAVLGWQNSRNSDLVGGPTTELPR